MASYNICNASKNPQLFKFAIEPLYKLVAKFVIPLAAQVAVASCIHYMYTILLLINCYSSELPRLLILITTCNRTITECAI